MSTQAVDLATVPFLTAVSIQQKLLMCPPRLYEVDYVINPWMAGNVHGSSRERAAVQWQHLHDALSDVADILLVQPQPGSPDMVFTANAGLERNGTVVLSRFFHPERQGEETHFRRWFADAGYRVIEIARETPFEGEGDALFSSDGGTLFVGHGTRTSESSHHALKSILSVDVVPLHLVDPRFYHLDTCFAPLSDGSILYFADAFSPESLHKIEAFYAPEKRIPVSMEDALNFACNAVNIGQSIVLNTVTSKLRKELQSRGFKVTEVGLSEFLKAGGAAKCLVMKLGPMPR